MIKKYSLVLVAIFCFVLSGFGQISEGFETGMPTSYTTGNITLGSGIWTGTNVIRGTTGVNSGSYSCQIRSATAAQITSPMITTGGLGTITFYASSSTATGSVQVNYRINGGAWIAATGSTFSVTSTITQYTATVNSSANNIEFQFYRTSSTIYIDDVVTTVYGTPSYSVTYDGNNNDGGTVPTDAGSYTSGDTVTVLGNTGSLTNTCNTFNNWNTAADGSGTSYSAGNTFTITTDTTLYAQWTPTGNTVTFNANGGTGTMSDQVDCASANLTNNTFTYTGYTFNSWNTAADGSGTTYADGALYDFSADLTLYAQWDVYVGPCMSEGFEGGTSDPSGWANNSAYYNFTVAHTGTLKAGMNLTGDWIRTDVLSNPSTLTFWSRASGSGSNFSVIVQYSANSGGPWTDATTISANGSNSGSVTDSYAQTSVSLNLSGNYYIRWFMSARSSGSLYLDDVEVFCGTPCTPPADPSGTISSIDAPDFCETAELSFSGSAPADIVYYWQTDSTGIDTTNDASNALDVTADGDFYVRAYNTVTSCWSSGAVGPYTVTISNLPEITDQPDNINVTNGGTATFSASVTGAVSYQWQVSTDDGATWTNTGTNSTTLTVLGVNISMHGFIYRIIATNSCGNTLSDEAVLFVHSGSPCIEEDFNSFPDTGWTDNGTSIETNGFHSGVSQPCRVFGTNDAIITSQTDYPTILEFYQDASSGGDGNTATVDYRIGTGAWLLLHSFSVTEAGKTELVDLTDVSGVNLASQANVSFRFNSTFNSWYLDDVKVYCTPCTPPTITTSIDLSSGPIGTYVTISGSQLGTATVSINSISLTPISQNANEIVIQIPNNAIDGSIIIQTNSLICDTAFPFDVIDQELSCQTNLTPPPTDLFIYELFDEDQNIDGPGGAWGNGGMITVFNGTLETKDLSEYRLYRSTDYTDTGNNPYSLWHSLSGTLAPGEVYRIWIDGSNCSDYPTPYETEFIGFNANDGVELRKNNGSGSYLTIDQLHTANIVGYHYLRDLSATKPIATFNSADWAFTDIYPSSPNCVGAGQAPNFEGGTPSIALDTPTTTCSTFEITANATEGYTGIYGTDTYNLTFQWYYFDGINDVWNPISTGGDYTVVNSTTQSTLTIDNILTKTNYQFYCEVSEGSSCYTASEAIRIELNTTSWNGTTWSNGAPDQYSIASIEGDYTTNAANGSFTACQLYVTSGSLLTIAQGYYVEVINNVEVTGNGTENDGILIEDKGSFVQRGDGLAAGSFTLNTNGFSKVNKRTAPLNNYYEYTYWSSPTVNETVGEGLFEAHPTRRYWYNAQNYLDETAETNNNNGTVNGQDDIDDNGDDWQPTANGNVMIPGVGYAAMHDPIGFDFIGAGGQFEYIFEGAFNTGDIDVSIYRNDSELNDNNWNFIGNPYPSAINADDFLTANAIIDTNVSETTTGVTDGAIFLWSQNSPYTDTNNGNEVLNFAQSDYAVINGTGQTAGGDGVMPSRFIPSGQGFFISYSDAATPDSTNGDINTGTVSFTNSMRVTGNNNQFFRNGNNEQAEKIWLNLTSDNGVFNQILIGYIEGATNGYDGMYYDAPKNLSTDSYSMFYSIIEDINGKDKLAIQGKSPESLNIDEIIPLGFITSIDEATIYTINIAQLEGAFFTENTIYLKDKLLNIIHDLSANDYSFTSEIGEFNDRFEIVFKNSSLSINEEDISTSQVSIIEYTNGNVQFTVPSQYEIKSIQIMDLLGRTIYQLKGDSYTETYDLSNLSQATYIAKITLSDGQVITKKAVKRK